jgi:transcriptional regulator with XRE-family HTH domain
MRGTDHQAQVAFAGVVASLLRESRRRQGLTQAELAARTGGLISKAALANYETGHRSLRVDVFWVLAKALGEDPGSVLAGAERGSGYGAEDDAAPITVDIATMRENTDERLAPVRRWFALRLQGGSHHVPIRTVTLDHGAVSALSALMGVTPGECRRLLMRVASPVANESTDAEDAPPRRTAAVG